MSVTKGPLLNGKWLNPPRGWDRSVHGPIHWAKKWEKIK